MLCPRDHTSLTVATAEGHSGYLCGSCSGVLLPQRFINALQYIRNFSSVSFYAQLKLDEKGLSQVRCPACAEMLNETSIHGIEIDWCHKCQSVWFDAGELKRLVEALPRIPGTTAAEYGAGAGAVLEPLLWALFLLGGS